MDGSVAGAYPDLPYSPEEAASGRRGFSFSDQRNPFAQTDYNRDRMPSTGGWNGHSPEVSSFKPRDRDSLALAPDQQMPATNPEYSKPIWYTESHTARTKKRKLDHDMATPVVAFDAITAFYRNIHPLFPILPAAAIGEGITEKARVDVQYAFLMAVQELPFKRNAARSQQNGTANPPDAEPTALVPVPNDAFSSMEDMETFLQGRPDENYRDRSVEDNLVYLWTCLLTLIRLESDIRKYCSTGTSSYDALLKVAVELGIDLVTRDEKICLQSADKRTPSPYHQVIHQTWGCTSVLGRLHAIGVAKEYDPIPSIYDTTRSATWLSAAPAFLVKSSVAMGMVIAISSSPARLDSTINPMQAAINFVSTHLYLHPVDLSEEMNDLYRLTRAYFDLILARHKQPYTAMYVVSAASCLAQVLLDQSKARLDRPADRQTYNPFDIHAFILVTVTLLEIVMEDVDLHTSTVGLDAVRRVNAALEYRADKPAHAADGGSALSAGYAMGPGVSWVDTLLYLVNKRWREPPKPRDVKADIALDFGLLLKEGYMKVLLQMADL